jgi:cobalt-zinc-cadmium efflux system outer membrane protein
MDAALRLGSASRPSRSWLRRHTVATVCTAAMCGCATSHPAPVDDNLLSAVQPTHNVPVKSDQITAKPATAPAKPSIAITPARHDSPVLTINRATKPQTSTSSESVATTPRVLNVGITLDQAINACLLADPKLRAGFEAINQASADSLTASLRPNPTLTADVVMLPLTRAFTPTAQGGPPQADYNVSYPIDWFLFGKRAAAMAAGALGVRVSEADYADLVRQRATDTAVAYYNVVEAKALLSLAKQDVESLQQVEGATRRGREAGTLSQLDLNRVSLDLISGQRNLRDAESTLASAKAKLRALLGRSDADPDFDVAATLDTPLTGPAVSVEDALAQALSARPDLQSLNWKLAQAQASIESERRKAYPSVAPALGVTRQYQQSITGFPDATSWNATLAVSLPFSDRNQGNRAKAASVAVQSNQQLQLAVVELRAEIESVAAELNTARANADAVAQDQLKLATAVRDAIVLAYRAGDKPLIDVLDAQRNYRDTYRAYYSSRANFWRALHKFQSAIGQQVQPYGDQSNPPGAAGQQ